MSHGLQYRYYAPRSRSCVHPVGARTEEPQRLRAAEPQPKCERPLNRRDAMSAEKTAGEKTLLELRASGLLHCDERRENSMGESAQTRFPSNAWPHLGPRDP